MSQLTNANYNTSSGAGGANNGNNGSDFNAVAESNQMFDKILSEVIHVSAFEQHRGHNNTDITNHPVQDMPFKFMGLLEPTRQQLMLPDGVSAPLSVLESQPPFASDIRLINNIAHDAQLCINNYTLFVPDNVAFDFNPVT